MGSANKEDSFKLLDTYFQKGGNFIDTASNYQNELSEKYVGEWMKTRKNRDHIILATKYTMPYKLYETGPGTGINYSGNSRRNLYTSVRDSLHKLQTEWLDILYLHMWDWSASIPEVMDSLHNLVEQGKVLYLGISDTPAWLVAAANDYALFHGKTPFSIYQGKWSIVDRDFERDIIPMARHYGMALAPWGVLGGGRLQSKKSIEARKETGEGIRSHQGTEQTPQEAAVSAALEQVAKQLGNVPVPVVALAYILHKAVDINVFPIIGGRRVEQLEENLQALDIRLTQKQVDALEGVVPFNLGFPNNFIKENSQVTGKTLPFIDPAGPIVWASRPAPKP
ncbi:hypothetical protein AYO21_00559 [Fonsecaea monophora]|uniref:NADP-dependent oxidoreductase domain-containing protein n=1 Tax=Fonsecaea monophora TaxID=254056 RepID=A0A177FN37_9EURO|nr:hypothetical protein AYO21_00559 [Fonsecaea monophora]OAG45211.1 hypothetical protein AYO21_00559 [Fonsecaea monophora]